MVWLLGLALTLPLCDLGWGLITSRALGTLRPPQPLFYVLPLLLAVGLLVGISFNSPGQLPAWRGCLLLSAAGWLSIFVRGAR